MASYDYIRFLSLLDISAETTEQISYLGKLSDLNDTRVQDSFKIQTIVTNLTA